MISANSERLMRAYPMIYLACHRQHLLADESGHRLTAQQSSVLQHLDNQHPQRVSELAAHMDVTEATMSIHLSRLEHAGYIRRERDRQDRRRVLLRLTAKGRRVKGDNSMFDPARVRELLGSLRPRELEAALGGLETLARAAEIVMRRRQMSRRRKAA
jgi:MarR family transcriptional regulator, organic hydroperoxide resistance regulator